MRITRGLAAFAAAAALTLLAPVAATPAFAADPTFVEDFSSGGPNQAPAGWTVESTGVEGMKPTWDGWTFRTLNEVIDRWTDSGARSQFSRSEGVVAVLESGENPPSGDSFTSVLWSPRQELTGEGAVEIGFDTHYRAGRPPQGARLVARFDGGAPVTVEAFNDNLHDKQITARVDAPEGAQSVQIGWSYENSYNNWYWMVDDVEIEEIARQDAVPELLTDQKLYAAAGEPVVVRVGDLRPGDQLVATMSDPKIRIAEIPVADAKGETSITVTVPKDTAAGSATLSLDGTRIARTSATVTILSAREDDTTTTQQQLWFDGFESDTWTVKGGWDVSTIEQVIAERGTDRRQAFTRADGRIMVAEASSAAVDASLTSAPIPVSAGDELELRVKSHFRKRGDAPQGTVTVRFDKGEQVVLSELREDQESAQLRLPFTVPQGATSATVEFDYPPQQPRGHGCSMTPSSCVRCPTSPRMRRRPRSSTFSATSRDRTRACAIASCAASAS